VTTSGNLAFQAHEKLCKVRVGGSCIASALIDSLGPESFFDFVPAASSLHAERYISESRMPPSAWVLWA
jgi:hypothetical protein